MAIKISLHSRSERLAGVLGIVALVAVGCAAYFAAFRPPAEITKEIAQHPFLDPAQSLYDRNDLLVNMFPLAQQLKEIAGRYPSGTVVIYFQYLNTGSDIRINTTPLYPGSLMKVPVAMAVMRKIESGAWNMDTELTLQDADKNPNYGTLYMTPSGTKISVAVLLQDLLVQSDDTARAVFIHNLGTQQIENVLDYLGLQDVINNNEQISAQRYSNFWRALFSSGFLSADDSQTLLQIMAQPHDLDLLAAGLPSNVIFSHKIGVFDDTRSDSGIVYAANRPYILTVMMMNSSTAETAAAMKEISGDVYQYVTTSNGGN